MLTGLLTVDETFNGKPVGCKAIKVCENCGEHEGQHLMNPAEVQKGAEEIWYCTECEKATC